MNTTYTLAKTEHGQFIVLRDGRAFLQAVRTQAEGESLLARIARGERHDHREGCRVRYKCGDTEFVGTALYTIVC